MKTLWKATVKFNLSDKETAQKFETNIDSSVKPDQNLLPGFAVITVRGNARTTEKSAESNVRLTLKNMGFNGRNYKIGPVTFIKNIEK